MVLMGGWRAVLTTGLTISSLLLALAAPGKAYERPATVQMVTISEDGLQQVSLPAKSGPSCTGDGGANGTMDITPNGRYVVFSSDAANLDGLDTNLACDIFLTDTRTGSIQRVSLSSSGAETVGMSNTGARTTVPDSIEASISANGRFVSFVSAASNLVPGDTNDAWDVFVRDVRMGSVIRVSLSPDGKQMEPAEAVVDHPSISGNGQRVSFLSDASNLVKDDPNTLQDLFVRDLQNARTIRATTYKGQSSPAEWGRLDHDGSHIVWASSDDVDGKDEPNNPLNIWRTVVDTGASEIVSAASDGTRSERFVGHSYLHSWGGREISADGRFIVFQSSASNLVPGDGNDFARAAGATLQTRDAFVKDMVTGRLERVSVNSVGQEGEGIQGSASISPDGRYVTFATATDSFDENSAGVDLTNVYVYDRRTGSLDLITEAAHDSLAPPCSAAGDPSQTSMPGALSQSARHVVFWSCSDRLVEGDNNVHWDIFVADRGPTLGFGGLGEDPGTGGGPLEDKICITPDICIPPDSPLSTKDEYHPMGLEPTLDLMELRVAHRPEHGDLFFFEEIVDMSRVGINGDATGVPHLYGIRFQVQGRDYEIRASSLLGGTIGLFDCSDFICRELRKLSGGYGTSGERIVFSLPLDAIGLEDGGSVSGLEAFSAYGTYFSGAQRIIDRIGVEDS